MLKIIRRDRIDLSCHEVIRLIRNDDDDDYDDDEDDNDAWCYRSLSWHPWMNENIMCMLGVIEVDYTRGYTSRWWMGGWMDGWVDGVRRGTALEAMPSVYYNN